MSDISQSNDTPAVADFDYLAKELASLLAMSDLDDKTAEALIESIPHLTLEQIVDLVSILEAKYVTSQTPDLDSQTQDTLETISQQFSGREETIDQETVQKITALAESID